MNRILAILNRYWLPLVAFNVVILVAASMSAKSVKQVWNANAKLILPSTSSNLNVKLGALGEVSGDGGLIFTQHVDSRRILSSIMTSDDLMRRLWKLDPEQGKYSRVEAYKKLFNVKPDDTSTVISLSVQGDTQEISRRRLSTLVQTFQQRLDELRKDDAAQRAKFIQKELVGAESNLKDAQNTFIKFQKGESWVDSENQTKELVTALQSLKMAQGQLSAQSKASQARLEALSARLGRNPGQAIATLRLSENVGYQELRQKLAKLEVALVEAQSTYTDESSKVQTLLLQKGELLRQQAQYITAAGANVPDVDTSSSSLGPNYSALVKELVVAESETRAFQQQTAQLNNQVEQLNAELKRVPAARARFLELQRQYNNSESVYNGLIAHIQATRVNAFSAYPSVQVLDQPGSSEPVPSGPGKKPVMLGAILASIFGSAAIVLFSESRNPLLTLDDLRKFRIPVVGKIPQLRSLGTGIKLQIETELEFQRLASAVSLMPLSNNRLMISSASPGEGKTLVTLGLATALLMLGFRVLIVDADFDSLELTKRVGCLQKSLLNNKPQSVQLRPGLDLLSLVPEKDKATEYIACGKFEHWLNLAQSSNDYDYVLIDTKAVTLTNETVLMARIIPDLLFVAIPGVSKRNSVIDSLHHICRNKAGILGLIVNRTGATVDGYLYEQQDTEV